MKILLITGSFPPMKCGVGDYTFHLAQALAAQDGVQVAVLTSTAADECNQIELFAVMKTWRMSEIVIALRAIHASYADIVHIQYPTQGYGNGKLPWVLPIASFLMGKKVVQTWHEGYKSRRYAPELLLKSIVPGALITPHEAYRELLHPMLRWVLWKKRFLVIPIGPNIPLSNFNPQARKEIRRKYLKDQDRLVVFFGFVYPSKGAELLFDICDPESDHIVIAGEFGEPQACHLEIIRRASLPPWSGKSTIAGFLPGEEAAALLAAADAVVLPFRKGRGETCRGSVYAAVIQGTFVLTTSQAVNGYNKKRNVYCAKIDDIQEMRLALKTYVGVRRKPSTGNVDEWSDIAHQHRAVYNSLLCILS